MSRLHLRQHAPDHEHRVIRVTPESAGWEYVGFDLYKLDAGETARGETGDREVCLVFISGKAAVTAGDEDFGSVGARMSPFEGKPWSVYVPAGASWTLTAETPCEIAACSSPGAAGSCPPRVVGPDSHDVMTRGKGNNIRYVTDIINETDPADSLLVVEVITPAGNASSYPPHKHDRDAFPEETQLEEVYYHRLNPGQGFGFQRIYTDDRSLDVSMTIEDGDVTLVPRGYHPCAALHGYDLYYLNVMAGPKRIWRFYNDPQHEWMLKA
ncbi:MAG: 5-deoxy-glucuronate isomerase [Bauldia sp.]|nr:5-deoxy-glucuronate isomerase [Bauldia sp.]